MQAERAELSVTIRPYSPDDLQACRLLWVELTDWHRSIYHSPEIGGSDPGRYFDEHLQRVGAQHIWVADAGGQVVGLAGLIPGKGEYELEPLVVSATQRGMGIGRQLAETAMKAARARGIHQLTVRPVARNAPAIQFFHQLGFDILGRIELFIDFEPADQQVWQPGERLAQRDFRI